MMNNPCKYCIPPERFPGCHAHCAKYRKWKELHDAIRERERKEKASEYFVKRRY